MATIDTPHRMTASIPGTIARFTTAIRALCGQLANTLSAGFDQAPAWQRLDDRLLRDAGATDLDTEIARFHARSAEAEAGGCDPIAMHGLSSGEFMRWMRPDGGDNRR